MKKGQTYVAREKLMAIVAELGIPTEEKKGWTKVRCTPGSDKVNRRVYVPLNKDVRRIDLAGCDSRVPGAIPHESGRFGSVTQMVDPTLPEEAFLAAFRAILEEAVLAGDRAAEPKKAEKGKAVDLTPELTAAADESQEALAQLAAETMAIHGVEARADESK
jgi:hypothetical protein